MTTLRAIITTRTIMAKQKRIAELEAILNLITFTDNAVVDAYKFEYRQLTHEVAQYEVNQIADSGNV